MTTKKTTRKSVNRPKARTPEEREKQLVAAAVNLAEQQILDGTASPSVICHFLKLGSSRERLEQEMLAKKTDLVSAQKENLDTNKRIESLYKDAMEMMSRYSGIPEEEYEVWEE